MLQSQSYTNVLNMACLLSLREKEQLIRDMQIRVNHEKRPQTISREELLARVEAADRRIDAGQFRTHAEAVRHFEQRMSERIAV